MLRRELAPVVPVETQYPPEMVEESKWLAYDRKLLAKRWSMNDSEINKDKTELTWHALEQSLNNRATSISNPIEKEKFINLAKTASACGRVFGVLKGNLYSYHLQFPEKCALEKLLGSRNSQIPNDNYPNHGARCASYLVDMGITDTEAFVTAGLHDLAEVFTGDRVPGQQKWFSTKVKNVVMNSLETAFRENMSDLPQREKVKLVANLKRFSEIDEAGKTTAKKVTEKMERELSLQFGKEFSLNDYVSMREWLWTNGVKKIEADRESSAKGTNMEFGIVKDDMASNDKFEPLISVLGRAASNMNYDSALRKGLKPSIPISAELAYLAAALDHSYFPKDPEGSGMEAMEAKLRSEQRVALGIMVNHLPVYQAYGDPMRRLSLEIIYRAYMPEKFENLYEAARKLSYENGGNYFEDSAQAYALDLMRQTGKFTSEMHCSGEEVNILSDIEWEERKMEFMKGKIPILLNPNELYVPGYTRYTEAVNTGKPFHWQMAVDMKSAASIMEKMVQNCTSPEKRPRLNDRVTRTLGPDNSGFGSPKFWECLSDQHDLLRSRKVAGKAIYPYLLEEDLARMNAYEYDSNAVPQGLTRGTDRYCLVEDGINHAHSTLRLDTPDERRREFIEDKNSDDGGGRQVLNMVYCPREIMAGIISIENPPNIEIHVHGGETYAEDYVIRGSKHHGTYKHRGRYKSEVAGEEFQDAYAAHVAGLFIKLEQRYMGFEQRVTELLDHSRQHKHEGQVYQRKRRSNK